MSVCGLEDDDLDDEDRAILAEVAKKGYYHGRPKSVTCAPPIRIENPQPIPVAQFGSSVAKGDRTEFDEYQKKWDRFGSDDYIKRVERETTRQTKVGSRDSPAELGAREVPRHSGSTADFLDSGKIELASSKSSTKRQRPDCCDATTSSINTLVSAASTTQGEASCPVKGATSSSGDLGHDASQTARAAAAANDTGIPSCDGTTQLAKSSSLPFGAAMSPGIHGQLSKPGNSTVGLPKSTATKSGGSVSRPSSGTMPLGGTHRPARLGSPGNVPSAVTGAAAVSGSNRPASPTTIGPGLSQRRSTTVASRVAKPPALSTGTHSGQGRIDGAAGKAAGPTSSRAGQQGSSLCQAGRAVAKS